MCSRRPALKWDDETQMSVNAHAALLSQFAKAGRRAFRRLLSDAGAWRDSSDGWQCAERDVRLDSWEKARRMAFYRASWAPSLSFPPHPPYYTYPVEPRTIKCGVFHPSCVHARESLSTLPLPDSDIIERDEKGTHP